ncbi:hypothetical protein SAMN04488540_11349 [Ferrimonas sediminum]|uniref:Uncharacterized protein n=1 Tax=Ferrimonas sediminum TaxID=718193 RepID=A0A1G8WFF6_9GAMM|nr:hypothetical protein SAMN04488540_11349 [Ferrimonas sediminum]
MEFTIFCIIAYTAYIVYKKPHKQKLADRLLFTCLGLGLFTWVMMSWGYLMPVGNY